MSRSYPITDANRTMCAIILGIIGVGAAAAGYSAYILCTGIKLIGAEGVVWQRGSYDCGAAALQMVFSHFRIESDYERLALRLEISTGGTSMLRLKRAAESKGLRCSGWRLGVRDLNDIPLPAILFMRRNHFVVLDSLDSGGSLLVRDPARGRLQITRRRLESVWGGEALLFCDPESMSSAVASWFEPSRPLARKPS